MRSNRKSEKQYRRAAEAVIDQSDTSNHRSARITGQDKDSVLALSLTEDVRRKREQQEESQEL